MVETSCLLLTPVDGLEILVWPWVLVQGCLWPDSQGFESACEDPELTRKKSWTTQKTDTELTPYTVDASVHV